MNPSKLIQDAQASLDSWQSKQTQYDIASRQSNERPSSRGGISSAIFALELLTTEPTKAVPECYGIFYSKRLSAPGGRLAVNVGGQINEFGPGDWIRGARMSDLKIGLAKNSATQGVVHLVLVQDPELIHEEDLEAGPGQSDLLGSLIVYDPTAALTSTFTGFGNATLNQNAPNVGIPDGVLIPNGATKIRLLIDGGADIGSGEFQSCLLHLFWCFNSSADPVQWIWFVQQDADIYIQPLVPYGGTLHGAVRYRVATIDIQPAYNTRLYVSCESQVGGAGTVSLIVQVIK